MIGKRITWISFILMFLFISTSIILRIKDYLLENRSVEFAAVVRDHPFYKPRLIIRTKGKTTPAEALDKSIEKILSMTNAFAKHLK